jgi:NTE family protein
MATDISRGSLVRLPWDYHLYGLNPDDQLVADAVVASASVPGFFHPMPLIWSDRSTSLLVDGSTCSGFPIEVFDRPDDRPPRWPTFGLKLEAEPVSNEPAYVVKTAVQFVRALVNAAVNGNDEVHLADPGVLERTIFVDTSPIPALEFELSPEQQDDLFRWGQTAAGTFCDSWDWPGYLETNSVKDRLNRGRRAAAARGERSRASRKRTVALSE